MVRDGSSRLTASFAVQPRRIVRDNETAQRPRALGRRGRAMQTAFRGRHERPRCTTSHEKSIWASDRPRGRKSTAQNGEHSRGAERELALVLRWRGPKNNPKVTAHADQTAVPYKLIAACSWLEQHLET